MSSYLQWTHSSMPSKWSPRILEFEGAAALTPHCLIKKEEAKLLCGGQWSDHTVTRWQVSLKPRFWDFQPSILPTSRVSLWGMTWWVVPGEDLTSKYVTDFLLQWLEVHCLLCRTWSYLPRAQSSFINTVTWISATIHSIHQPWVASPVVLSIQRTGHALKVLPVYVCGGWGVGRGDTDLDDASAVCPVLRWLCAEGLLGWPRTDREGRVGEASGPTEPWAVLRD